MKGFGGRVSARALVLAAITGGTIAGSVTLTAGGGSSSSVPPSPARSPALPGARSSAPTSPARSQRINEGPEVVRLVGPVSLDTDLRNLPPGEMTSPIQLPELTRHTVQAPTFEPSDPPQAPKGPASPPTMPSPTLTFPGIGQPTSFCSCLPPDTNGDVGPSHYVQTVNVAMQIWNKAGTTLSGPTSENTFFASLTGTPCANQNRGDPVDFYDPVSGRWWVTDFAFPAFPGTSFWECIAVSQTADPVAGGWYLYALQVDPANTNFLGDYPKFGTWSDGIYLSMNMFSNNSTFNGVRVYALNRASMIAGGPANAIGFTITPATLGDAYSLVPATYRYGAPPAGRPEYLLAINSSAAAGTVENQVFVWKFHVDFGTPANSTLGVGATHTPNGTITVNNFVDAFQSTTTDIVPQPVTSAVLDTLGDKLMYPLAYQNRGGTESLYVSHTVNNNQNGTGPTGIRWYQFDITGGTIPAGAAQQQTFTNGADGLWRWMPSLAVDRQGDLAIGYSVSSASLEPSIRYAGRLAGDPANSLAQGEATLFPGGGHQTNSPGRWGDYSMTSVDPANGCAIWHTNEYFTATSSFSWATRIGEFTMPSCTPTAASLASFAATRTAGGAVITWRTSTEAQIAGFELFRGSAKLNRRLIPAASAGEPRGHAYRIVDRHAGRAHALRYRLQAVSSNGSRAWLGTASAP